MKNTTGEHGDDVILWADGSTCYASELHQFTWLGDDYRRVSIYDPDYSRLESEMTPF